MDKRKVSTDSTAPTRLKWRACMPCVEPTQGLMHSVHMRRSAQGAVQSDELPAIACSTL